MRNSLEHIHISNFLISGGFADAFLFLLLLENRIQHGSCSSWSPEREAIFEILPFSTIFLNKVVGGVVVGSMQGLQKLSGVCRRGLSLCASFWVGRRTQGRRRVS